ncbi:MAG: YicC family protein [Calditrichia bacterium]|nr:YicC family protein [Calditrichia bacterium]
MNQLKSMTGFAVLQKEFNNSEISCELRALNSRYLEISLRLPRLLTDLEATMKEIIRKKITRGKIMFNLNFTSLNSEADNLKIQPDLIRSYMKLLEQIKDESGITAEIQLDHLLFFKDIISFEENSAVDQKLANFIFKLTEEAIEKLEEMRLQEGQFLQKDLEERLSSIQNLSKEIREYGKSNSQKEFDKLYQRLTSLIAEDKIDLSRLEQELSIIADRVDITEEVVRMQSHIQLFEENLKKGSPVGKKLNFILQEMNRETNTMSNKSTLIEVSHRVVQLKEEIEKVREQVQNIE